MQQGIAKGDVLQRIAGIALIVGAIVTAVFNGLYPRVSDPSDVRAVLTKLAENETLTQAIQLGVVVGLWLILGGIVGIYRSLSTGAASAWARLGFYAAVVATATWVIVLAIGWAQAGAAANWVAAPAAGQATAYSIAASLYAVNMATFSMAIVVDWAGVILLGIAISLSTLYPKWMGWIAIVLGVVTIPAIGVPQAIAGPSQTIDLLFLIFSGLTLAWTLVMGVLITRKAW